MASFHANSIVLQIVNGGEGANNQSNGPKGPQEQEDQEQSPGVPVYAQ
jgi:hypothetical protein